MYWTTPTAEFRLPVQSHAAICGLALTLMCGSFTPAGALSLSCEFKDAATDAAPSQMDLTYKGDASGTLHIKAPFGEMDVPARMEKHGEGDEAMTGIRAFTETTALMPDKMALEDCVAAKLSAEQLMDKDLIFVQRLSCGQQTPMGPTPVPIKLSVEIAVGVKDVMIVYVVRTFLEKSRIGAEPVAIESVPPPSCKITDAN